MTWYAVVMRKYAVFAGRARRREYWFFVLFNELISLGIVLVGMSLAFGLGGLGAEAVAIRAASLVVLYLYALASFLPALAVSVRRLHDRNLRGWWVLIGLVPVAGMIVLIVFFAMDGDAGQNRFGPSPKWSAATAASSGASSLATP